MHLIIIQLQRQSPPVFGWLSSVKSSSPIHIFHRKTSSWHSHQCFQCFKFQSNFAITLHPTRFEKPTFIYIVVLLQSVPSCNCWSYWNLKVSTRVPRLESSYVSIHKLQPLCCVTCNFWRGLHCEGWKSCRAHFCEVPPKQNKILTAKMAFDRCWRLQYWTLVGVERATGIAITWPITSFPITFFPITCSMAVFVRIGKLAQVKAPIIFPTGPRYGKWTLVLSWTYANTHDEYMIANDNIL